MSNRGTGGQGCGGGHRGRSNLQQSLPHRSSNSQHVDNHPAYTARGNDRPRGGNNPRGGRGNRVGYIGTTPFHSAEPVQAGIYREKPRAPEPDAAVTAAENRMVQETRGNHFPLPKSDDKDVAMMVPGRRSYGTTGAPITLRTNYLTINTKGDKTLYRYAVDITEQQAPSKAFKRQIFEYILNRPVLQDVIKATDYSSTLITASRLDFLDADGVWSQKNQYLHAHNPARPPKPGSSFGFRIKFVCTFSLQNTLRQLAANVQQGQPVHADEITHALNIVFSRAPNIKQQVAISTMNKFFPYGNDNELADERPLGAGLIALRGYYSSVRTAVNRMLLNVNATAGAFYRAQPATELLAEIRHLSVEQQGSLVNGLRVVVNYGPQGNDRRVLTRVRTISSISDRTPSQITFPRNGQTISVRDHFERQYGINLQFSDRSCFNVGTGTPGEYVPPELCYVLPGQQYRRFLSGEQTTVMLNFAARRPNENAHNIAGGGGEQDNVGAQGLRLLALMSDQNNQPDPQITSVHNFGIQVGTQLLTVPGRVLQTPAVTYLGNTSIRMGSGQWNCASQKFIRAGVFYKTAALVVRPPSGSATDDTLRRSLAGLRDYVQRCGTRLGDTSMLTTTITDCATAEWSPINRAAVLSTLTSKFDSLKKSGVQLVIVVLDAADRWVYSQLKKLADTQYGIHTVCCVREKLIKVERQEQFFGNLALKINIKGGGRNHSVKQLFSPPLTAEKTMLVGIDVTHPSPGSAQNAPSIACVVANTDSYLAQWPGSIQKRQPATEIVTTDDKKGTFTKYHREINDSTSGNVREMMEERLAVWKKFNNDQLPDRIVIFRDGVSEGQYDLVLRYEWPEIQASFKKFYKLGPEPKVAIIVVGKRHHTRFYPTAASKSDKTFNPVPGTIVDRGIANKIMSEFWLQAHFGLQGTARPAHYVVIKDDIGFDADQLQNFTHKLCYTFTRATRAISICPPAYYADLLADRTRMYEYEALNENNGGNAYNPAQAAWNGTIHNDVKDRTWYI